MREKEDIDITVVMPCKNEQATVGYCVDEAKCFIKKHGLTGEVLVVDNASTDKSAKIAKEHGARVVYEKRPGYGRALRTGIAGSRGRVIIMGDCDSTYNFLQMGPIYALLNGKKCDMVIGDRFAMPMERGAMPLSHKFGVAFLSFLGRVRFHVKVHDFHCGLRGLTRVAAEQMDLHTTGMEFASEMIGCAAKRGLKIRETAVSLRKPLYKRSSKLRAVRDGLWHIRYILTY